MLSFVIASLLFILICIASLIISYYVVVILNEDKTTPEPALNAIIATNILLLFTYVVETISDTFEIVAAKLVNWFNFLSSNSLNIARVGAVVGLVLLINSDLPAALQTCDSIFRCVIQPLFQNVFIAIFQVIRIFFDSLVPIYNYYSIILNQATRGSLAVAVKCDIKTVYETLKIVIQIFVAQFRSVYEFSGVKAGMSIENNIFVNEFNITDVINQTQYALYHQKSVVDCACDGLSDIAELFFVAVNTPHPPRIINHVFNIFIASIQMLIQIAPPFSQEPSLQKLVWHINKALFEAGRYLDVVLIRWAEIIIRFFDNNFQIQGAPKNFIFTSFSRFGIGLVHLFHTIIRSEVGILIPIKTIFMNSDYLVQLTNIDHTIIQWRLGIEHLTSCIYYFSKIIEVVVYDLIIPLTVPGAAIINKPKIPSIPPFVELNCWDKPFLSEQAKTISCITYFGQLFVINSLHLVWSLAFELLWKSLIFQEQNVLRTIQRYDGLSYPKSSPITCEVRKQAKADEWDLTNKECLCEKEYDFNELQVSQEYPFGIKTYDPYCGQPNLQADIFGVTTRLINYIGNFVGIRLVFGLWENFYLTELELLKIGIKFVLNFADLVSGNFFTYPINCGYGVSESALEEWWLSKGRVMNSEYCESQSINGKTIGKEYDKYIAVEYSNQRKSGRGKIEHYIDPVYSLTSNGYGHFTSRQYSSAFTKDLSDRTGYFRCYPKHEFIRFYKCVNTKYTGSDYCSENKNGCTCNVLKDIQPSSHCQCVYQFPDTEQEVAQNAFNNPLLKMMDINYFHLCNTYFTEHFLYYIEKTGKLFDDMVTDLHPGYKLNVARPITQERCDDFGNCTTFVSHYEYDTYCTSASASQFEVYRTTMLDYSVDLIKNLNQGTLYDSVIQTEKENGITLAQPYLCRTYGTKDFVCSATLTTFHAIKFVTNEVRIILMTLFNFIGDPSLARFKADISERLCDLQRSLAGISSMFASVIAGAVDAMATSVARASGKTMGGSLHRAFSKVIFVGLSIIPTVLQSLNLCLIWITKLVNERPNFFAAVLQFIVDQLVNILDWFIQLLDALDFLVKDIVRMAGGTAGVNFFGTFKEILQMIRSLLKGIVFKLWTLVTKLGMNFMECFTGGGCDKFLSTFTEIFDTVFNWLVTDGLKMLEKLIFKLLGPVGDLLRTIMDAGCNALKGLLTLIGAKTSMKCPQPPAAKNVVDAVKKVPIVGDIVKVFVKSGKHHNRRKLKFAHPFRPTVKPSISIDNGKEIPFVIAHDLEWEGHSECDMHVRSYMNYTWEQLRPIEQNHLKKCVENRFYAFLIGKLLDLPVPYDLFYNWKRKYMMGYDFVRALIIFVNQKTGKMTAHEMMHKFKQSNIDIDLWLPILQFGKSHVYQMFSLSNIHDNIHYLLDQAIDISGKDSIFSDVKYIFNTSTTIFSKTAKGLIQTYNEAPIVYRAVMDIADNTEFNVTAKLRSAYDNWQGFDIKGSRSVSQENARRIILKAAGVSSDTTPCNERSQTYTCTNCVILDNFANTVIAEGISMAQYYKYQYAGVVIPGWVRWLTEENEEAAAWREDMGQLLYEASIKAGTAINKELNAAVEDLDDAVTTLDEELEKDAQKKRRRYNNLGNTKNYTNSSNYVYLTNFERAKKDWDYLFANFAVRNEVKFWTIIDKLFTELEDGYVPFFAYSLPYYVSYPLTEACPSSIIYCHTTDPKERLRKIPESMWYYLYFAGAIFALDRYTSLPVWSMFSPWQMTILAFWVLFYVYGWFFTCFPNIPNCMADDALAFVNDVLFPDCFCSYFPGIAKTCNPDTCFLCSKQTGFYECQSNIPLLEQHGIYWAPLFWARVNYPDTMVWLLKTVPFSWFLRTSEIYTKMVEEILGKKPITDLEMDCYNFRFLDIVLLTVLFTGSAYFLSILIPLSIKYTQAFIKIFPMFLLTVTNMATSIELQSISGMSNDI